MFFGCSFDSVSLTLPADACSATASKEAKETSDRIQQNLEKGVPKPVVKIDNQHDPFATVVDIEYGNELGELLDTVGVSLTLRL